MPFRGVTVRSQSTQVTKTSTGQVDDVSWNHQRTPELMPSQLEPLFFLSLSARPPPPTLMPPLATGPTPLTFACSSRRHAYVLLQPRIRRSHSLRSPDLIVGPVMRATSEHRPCDEGCKKKMIHCECCKKKVIPFQILSLLTHLVSLES